MYTEEEKKILKRAYIDYKQLERKLYIDFGDTKDLRAVYNYIKKLSEQTQFYRIDFTNVELDEGYFDFNYNDMCLTISVYNQREVVQLAENIEIWNDKETSYLTDLDFEDLEKIVLEY